MVINVNMLGKASGQHSLMLFNASVAFFATFKRESFRYHSLSSDTNSSGILLSRFDKTFPKLEYFRFVERLVQHSDQLESSTAIHQ